MCPPLERSASEKLETPRTGDRRADGSPDPDLADGPGRLHAVLIVHGIGEQRETDTARKLAKALHSSDEDAIYSRPYLDRSGSNQRLYRIRWGAGRAPRPPGFRPRATDVGEGYWAYRFRDTAWNHVTGWLRPMIRTGRSRIPERLAARGSRGLRLALSHALLLPALTLAWAPSLLRSPLEPPVLLGLGIACLLALAVALRSGPSPAWLFVAFLSGAALAVLAAGPLIHAFSWQTSPEIWWIWIGLAAVSALAAVLTIYREDAMTIIYWLVGVAGLATVLLIGVAQQLPGETVRGLGSLLALLAPVGVAAVSARVLPSVGDAARYLNDHPANELENREVRRIVIERIRQLHEATDADGPLYGRITVIGHSLGSVIAYDALKHYWAEVNQRIDLAASVERRSAVERYEEAAAALQQTSSGSFGTAFRSHRTAQRRLCASLDGPPSGRWIVSDFITLGSPLASLDLLTGARDDTDDKALGTSELSRRRREKEYPTCPPVEQSASPARYRDLRGSRYLLRFPRDRQRFLHQAAPFAPTRWTNLYFEHDIVGGPIGPLLGRGICDVNLSGPPVSPWAFASKGPHSSYWLSAEEAAPVHRAGAQLSLEILRGLIRRPYVGEEHETDLPFDALEFSRARDKPTRARWHGGRSSAEPSMVWRSAR